MLKLLLSLAVVVVLTMKPCNSYAASISCSSSVTKDYTSQEASQYWPSHGAPKKGTCSSIYISGEIVAGDYNRLLKLLDKNHPYISGISLNSKGGSVSEAIKIGYLVRK